MQGTEKGTIKYGIGAEYLPDWGEQEALREIYQNFKDFGEYEQELKFRDSEIVSVTLTSQYNPRESGDFLRIGKSGKRDDSDTIGQHGEGLKMAALVLHRCGSDMTIQHCSTGYKPVWYEDNYLGRCFGLSVRAFRVASRPYCFRVYFTLTKEAWETWSRNRLGTEHTIYSCWAGKVIDKTPGDVYVGGFFVSNISGLTRAYDFPPNAVPLDRDRKIPKEFDVLWAAGQILSGWEETTVEDLVAKDSRHLQSVPKKLAKTFLPSVDPVTGRADFTVDGLRAPEHVAKLLMKDPATQKKVSKMRYELTRKRKPTSILKDFMKRHSATLYGSTKTDFEMIIRKSKDWK